MSRIDNEILHDQMNWRYACKKFDATKKIREADWNILTESLRLSASSYGLQPWKFLVIQNPELRKQFKKSHGDRLQSQKLLILSFLHTKKKLMKLILINSFNKLQKHAEWKLQLWMATKK